MARSLGARRLAICAYGRQRGRATFCDRCGSPATPPERVLSVTATCSLRELPRLRARASRIADPLTRARSAAPPPPLWPCSGVCSLPAGLQRGVGSAAGGKRPPSLAAMEPAWRHSPHGWEGLSQCQSQTLLSPATRDSGRHQNRDYLVFGCSSRRTRGSRFQILLLLRDSQPLREVRRISLEKENTQCVLYSDPGQHILYAFFACF